MEEESDMSNKDAQEEIKAISGYASTTLVPLVWPVLILYFCPELRCSHMDTLKICPRSSG